MQTDAPTEQSEPLPAPTPDFEGTAQVTDADGYTFSIAYRWGHGTEWVTEIGTEKPGFSAVVAGDPSASIIVTNTTSGREIPFELQSGVTSPLDQPEVRIVARWAGDSTICATLASDLNGSAMPDRACEAIMAFGRIPGPLGADESRPLETYIGGEGGVSPGLASVPDSALEAITAELDSATFALQYDGVDASRFNADCTFDTIASPPPTLFPTNDCSDPLTLFQPII